MKLIPEWRKALKFWSVRLSALGAVLMSIVLAWPDSILYLWSMMPYELSSMIPERVTQVLALFIFIMSAVSRIVKQKRDDE